jgi:hypothetical protein
MYFSIGFLLVVSGSIFAIHVPPFRFTIVCACLSYLWCLFFFKIVASAQHSKCRVVYFVSNVFGMVKEAKGRKQERHKKCHSGNREQNFAPRLVKDEPHQWTGEQRNKVKTSGQCLDRSKVWTCWDIWDWICRMDRVLKMKNKDVVQRAKATRC